VCWNFDSLKLARLAGARAEVVKVAELWKSVGAESSLALTGAAASEANFKRLAHGHRMIHIATHGFFLQPDCPSRHHGNESATATRVVKDNPLLLTGLCLAGANRHRELAGLPAGEDGILTAEEVCSLDLRGTDWVILSSCESGLGRVVTGEGVYGLRRSFLMAGARTVFSTLWQIPDRGTGETIRALYGNTRRNIPRLLQEASRSAISNLRKRGQPDHPYNWAAFIAIGAWEPRP